MNPTKLVLNISKETTVRQLVDMVRECAKSGDLEKGKALHVDAIEAGCDSNKYVSTGLINMYGKCGSMDLAQRVFEKMVRRNIVAWTSLILGYVENGESLVALELFQGMDCEPDYVCLIAALHACSVMAAEKKMDRVFCLEKGMAVHRKARVQMNALVKNRLVDLYSKLGSMLHAKAVFDSMVCRDVVSWNSLILGYAENGESLVAMEIYWSMDKNPDSVTFVAVLKAAIGLASDKRLDRVFCFEKGRSVHRQAKLLGFDTDVFVANTLVEFYRECAHMVHARAVFNNMVEKSAFSWTSLVLGYVENGESLVALDVWRGMDCEPDSVTFVAGLKGCSGLAAEGQMNKLFCLEKGMGIHRQAKTRGVDGYLKLSSSLVDMYWRCGSMLHARAVFGCMAEHDVVSWNSLILGYVANTKSLVALEFFLSMSCEPSSATFVAVLQACSGLVTEKYLDRRFCLEKGMILHKQALKLGFDTDNTVANTLLDMYSRCRSMSHAQAVFNRITHKDVISWNTLMLGYVETGETAAALDLFTSMNSEPNYFTLVVALKACASTGAVGAGKRVHALICKLGMEQNVAVANSLLHFYGKCGRMAAAEQVFNRMLTRDVVSWNTLIAGYSLSGHVHKILELVKRMQETGSEMNEITLLLVLSACSHLGLMDEGMKVFETMTTACNLSPAVEHYSCLIDMLGRADSLQGALAAVQAMPFEGDSVVWRTLLGACRSWRKVDAGKVASSAMKFLLLS